MCNDLLAFVTILCIVQIDPFDLDVFMPHLTANVQRNISRLATLLGVLDGGQSQRLNQVRLLCVGGCFCFVIWEGEAEGGIATSGSRVIMPKTKVF